MSEKIDPAPAITQNQALALCVAQWGRGAFVAIVRLGTPDVPEDERECARHKLKLHRTDKPKLVQIEHFPQSCSVAEYRLHVQVWYEASDAWNKRESELLSIAYGYRHVVGGGTEPFEMHRFEALGRERGAGYSWEEALKAAHVID